MTETEFRALARRARLLTGDYGNGYVRGLRRACSGDKYGPADEHARWMRMGLDDGIGAELGRGYRDGFACADPTPRIGRPPVAASAETPVRTMRLSDAHWSELQARGGVAALRNWLS